MQLVLTVPCSAFIGSFFIIIEYHSIFSLFHEVCFMSNLDKFLEDKGPYRVTFVFFFGIDLPFWLSMVLDVHH